MQDLIRDILEGHEDRFRELVRQFTDDLLRVAYHFVHDWDDAQDLTQATWIRCYRGLRRYDPQRPFRPWLYRIHMNVCKAAARRKGLRRSREEPLSASSHELRTEIGADDTNLILREIEKLPTRQKSAFILVEIEGMNSREAAYVLGCADSTLRVHLARAKQTLRHNLTKLGLGYESI